MTDTDSIGQTLSLLERYLVIVIIIIINMIIIFTLVLYSQGG